ncbi:histidine kinase [Sphingomonas sp. BN140010]|uniref:Histidine kinase n=1 Tax=Sphingomonas arvum TaxID=2992113 RepID=A0ABT3JIG7_9SPHN|nr:histidine kinase [Sphingomonas sp. BN140010]MCW3798566.1 histidine kinase [Sphingomonas sp. BN140010]
MLRYVDATAEAHAPREERPFADWKRATSLIILFWLAYTVTVVARAFLGDDPATFLLNKLVMLGVGTVLTFGIYVAIQLFAPQPDLGRKAVVAGVTSLIAASLLSAMLMAAEGHMRSSKEEFRFQAREGFVVITKGEQVRIERRAADPVVLTLPKVNQLSNRDRFRLGADTAVIWLFFFVAWSAFYLAAVSQAQALALQRRAALAESAAQSAQVRALRYQVNPHFLFNTLNSLSSLVMAGRSAEAETMILKLSNFFRSSLSLDATADVTLAEEIDMQRLYLDIEKVRFPRRLKVEIDVPAYLGQARLPALVLQPVVENAIKYGVSATRDKVTLRIEANEPYPGRLQITITNSGGTALKSPRQRHQPCSTGVGLTNVCQRLAARFGRESSCSFGPMAEGGYRVVMTLPLNRDPGTNG